MHGSCASCDYFKRQGEQGGQAVGLCKRMPPTVLMTAIQGVATQDNPHGQYIAPVSYRPQVQGLDGCGEWAVAAPTGQKSLSL